MKSINIGLGLALVIMGVSALFIGSYLRADDNEKSSELVKQILTPGISILELDGVANVTIVPDGKEFVEFSYDPNQYSNKSSFNRETLQIRFKNNRRKSNGKIRATVHCKTLEKIENDGVGSIDSKGSLKTEVMKLVGQGVGSFQLEVETSTMVIENDGVGGMEISGNTDSMHIINSGVGSLDLSKLKSKIADVYNSGVGSVSIYVSKIMYLKSTGVGGIAYSGEGVIQKIENRGVGSITLN